MTFKLLSQKVFFFYLWTLKHVSSKDQEHGYEQSNAFSREGRQ